MTYGAASDLSTMVDPLGVGRDLTDPAAMSGNLTKDAFNALNGLQVIGFNGIDATYGTHRLTSTLTAAYDASHTIAFTNFGDPGGYPISGYNSMGKSQYSGANTWDTMSTYQGVDGAAGTYHIPSGGSMGLNWFAASISVTEANAGVSDIGFLVDGRNDQLTNAGLIWVTLSDTSQVSFPYEDFAGANPDHGIGFFYQAPAGKFITRVECTRNSASGSSYVALDDLSFVISRTVIANRPPTDIALSYSNVPENQPAGTVIGVLSGTDPDAGQSATLGFTLVPGYGDNSLFLIDPATKQLKTNAVFDYEYRSSYSIKVRATDTGSPPMTYDKVFTISVVDVNEAPTDITLSNSSMSEDRPIGTVLGVLSGTDPDVGQSPTLAFTLVPGYGDNSLFVIDSTADQLKTNAVFNYKIRNSYSIEVRATDTGSPPLSYDKIFMIYVTDGTYDGTSKTLTYRAASDLSSMVDPLGQGLDLTDPALMAGNLTKDAFNSLAGLQVIGFNAELTPSQFNKVSTITAAYDASHVLTVTDFGDPGGYNYGGGNSQGRQQCSGPNTWDQLGTIGGGYTGTPVGTFHIAVPSDIGLNWFAADLSVSQANAGVSALGFLACGRNMSGTCTNAGKIWVTLSNGSEVSFPYVTFGGGETDPPGIGFFYQAPAGLYVTRVECTRDPAGGNSFVALDDLGFVIGHGSPPHYIHPHDGDANNDGKVDVVDLGILAKNYDKTGLPTSAVDPYGAGSWQLADFYGDGEVDVVDLGILAKNYDWTGDPAYAAQQSLAGVHNGSLQPLLAEPDKLGAVVAVSSDASSGQSAPGAVSVALAASGTTPAAPIIARVAPIQSLPLDLLAIAAAPSGVANVQPVLAARAGAHPAATLGEGLNLLSLDYLRL